jgi:hypothetical protein
LLLVLLLALAVVGLMTIIIAFPQAFYFPIFGALWVLKSIWANMVEVPWHHTGSANEKGIHWLLWLIGWAWSFAGVILGALVAPSLAQAAGLSHTPYQDWFIIGVAVLVALEVQFLSLVVMTFMTMMAFLFGLQFPRRLDPLLGRV